MALRVIFLYVHRVLPPVGQHGPRQPISFPIFPAFFGSCLPAPGGPVSAGAVASLVAVLLQDGGAPAGMGPVSCIGIGPASAMNLALAKRCDHFVTSVCLRCQATSSCCDTCAMRRS